MELLIPIVGMLLVLGVPYLVIYLQGRRLAAVELQLAELTNAIRTAGLAESDKAK